MITTAFPIECYEIIMLGLLCNVSILVKNKIYLTQLI